MWLEYLWFLSCDQNTISSFDLKYFFALGLRLISAPFCRLGGIPVGVVAPETHPVETTIPPDPADLSSESKVGVDSFCGINWFLLWNELCIEVTPSSTILWLQSTKLQQWKTSHIYLSWIRLLKSYIGKGLLSDCCCCNHSGIQNPAKHIRRVFLRQ